MSHDTLRFSSSAASELRHAIREAGGVEVFAIGEVEDGQVISIEVCCRGTEQMVPALLERPRPGQAVIHNHPSGVLEPSQADLGLAARYGDDGIGVVIVDSEVRRSRWVVEPYRRTEQPVTAQEVEDLFCRALPQALDGYEPRPGQLQMAQRVAHALSAQEPWVVEAGTGTGKSLAYLVPAALWALANDGKVVVSTYTRALQRQLLNDDLPVLEQAGLKVRTALLQGRNNYLCKRRLGLALDEAQGDDRDLLARIADWEATSNGARAELPVDLEPMVWERIESDADLTLAVRCRHYDTCHYYTARREAAGAHLLVVNHALLLMDLAIKDAGGAGVLPKYSRLILDEAHHLEDAATGATSRRLTSRAVARAVGPLVGRRKRKGALALLAEAHGGEQSALPAERRGRLADTLALAAAEAKAVTELTRRHAEILAEVALSPDQPHLRITRAEQAQARWSDGLRPALAGMGEAIGTLANRLHEGLSLFDDVQLPEGQAQPLLDLRRGWRRLSEQARIVHDFVGDDDEACRWLELARARPEAVPTLAPIDVAPLLRRILWDRIPGLVCTSATLAVRGRFDFWRQRVGLTDPGEAVLASPFDHARQALLALPKDLPEPDGPGYDERSASVVVEAVRASSGGAFVLCTSYRAVALYAQALRLALPPDHPVLEQRPGTQHQLLARFRTHPNAVLVGTDSFWEGISVKGDALRLVVVPRLPFRMPSDPLRQARHERVAQAGGDPFRTYALPEAVLKLRQGYGRLIRSTTDSGVVLLLDRRLHTRTYGRRMLAALPPARRVVGPWKMVLSQVRGFFER